MIKAIFMDFYGTVVFEDGEVIEVIAKEILDTGKADNTSEIGGYWWREFQSWFMNSYGDKFQTQRALEYQSLENKIRHFNATAGANAVGSDAIWVNRADKDIPKGVKAVSNLLEVLDALS